MKVVLLNKFRKIMRQHIQGEVADFILAFCRLSHNAKVTELSSSVYACQSYHKLLRADSRYVFWLHDLR